MSSSNLQSSITEREPVILERLLRLQIHSITLYYSRINNGLSDQKFFVDSYSGQGIILQIGFDVSNRFHYKWLN